MDLCRAFVVLLSFVGVLKAQSPAIQDVISGSTVSLVCRPRSDMQDVPTTYQWFDPQNQVKGSNINLIIVDFTKKNEGTYTCKATQVIEGRVVSSEKSIFVRIKQPDVDQSGAKFVVDVPQIYNTFASGILFFMCKAPGGTPATHKFEWITPKGEKHSTSNFFKNHVNIDDSGRYTCRVTRVSDGAISEKYTMVNVNTLPITVNKVSGSIAMGQKVRLKCDIDKSKTDNKVFAQFSYVWTDPQNRQISTDPTIDLTLGDPSSFGVYTCKISAKLMNPPYIQSIPFEIKYVGDGGTSGGTGGGGTNTGGTGEGGFVRYTSSFSSTPKVVRYFEQLELNCGINPPLSGVTYQIFFNNQPVSTSNVFVIPRLSKQNLGSYVCNINGKDFNTGQTVDLNTTFTIQPNFRTGSKIELTNPPGPQIFVRAGDKRELHCEIDAELRLHGRDAVWYFNGQEITRSDQERLKIQILPRLYVSIMVLKNIKALNEGQYECKVRGDTKEAYILVMAKTKHMEVSPTDETRKAGDGRPVEFHCRIDGYRSKNKDIIWKFISKETGQTTPLDSRWSRLDDATADETSFVMIQQAESRDSGTYICLEPESNDEARGLLNVISEVRVMVTPPIIKLRAGQTARFQCYVINGGRSPEYPEFVMANGGRAGDSQRTSVEKLEAGKVLLTYREVTTNDNGTRFTCRLGRSTADVLVLVDPVCSAGSRLCRNGECINSARFCDGKTDCADGSDEDQAFCRQCDPLSKRCEIHNNVPPTNQIYQAHWGCDGEDDCGNGFDESRCYGNVLECGGLTYRCNDGAKTIPKAFLCDKDIDCMNGDDESKCVIPTIISEPTQSYIINARKGETVTITCQVNGYPLPKIVWRFNWGCLTDDQRMVVSESYRNCGSTISTLTISNFQNGDDGIYNCEGLSGGKRAWSRDYQLMMNLRN